MSRTWMFGAAIGVLLSMGCGGSSGGGGGEDTCPAGTTMQVLPPTITVAAGSAGFDAIGGLSNGCPAMVQWSVSGPGTISPTSGIPIHYTPPATVASTTTATLTATAAGLVDTIVVTITPASAANCPSLAGAYGVTTEIVSTTCAVGLHTITQPVTWTFVQTAPSCDFTMTNSVYPGSLYSGHFTMVGSDAQITWTSVTPDPTVLGYTLSYTSENLTLVPGVAPAAGTISGSFDFSMSAPCVGTTNVCHGSLPGGCATPN
jgi:hypothetical protein